MRRLQDVIFQRPKIVGRGCPLALHRRPYGDVHKTSLGEVLRTSSGRNFAEWVTTIAVLNAKINEAKNKKLISPTSLQLLLLLLLKIKYLAIINISLLQNLTS